jgi:hypothetical protein
VSVIVRKAWPCRNCRRECSRGLDASATQPKVTLTLVHNAAWQGREQACNNTCAEEKAQNRAPMLLNRVSMRSPHRDRKHHQREYCQQVDRTPGSPK